MLASGAGTGMAGMAGGDGALRWMAARSSGACAEQAWSWSGSWHVLEMSLASPLG
jgi:hypothetical protein